MSRLALLALAAALAGCGGKSTPVDDAAQLVPADARAYAVFAPASAERALEERAPLLARRAGRLRARFGLPSAPVVAGVAIDVARLPSGVVALARPGDPKRFARRLAGFEHTTIGGWVVFARTKALVEAVRRRKASLAEQPGFRAAVRALPGPAAYWAYAPGWTAGAIVAKGRTVTCELASKARNRNIDTAAVARRIPERAAVAFAGAPETVPAAGLAALAPAARFLSLDLHALVSGLDGPFAAWAAAGDPVPEVTVVARPRRPVPALRAVRKAVGRMAGAAPGAALDLGPVTVTTRLAAGQLVVSDADEPLAGPGPLRPHGLPGQTEWWLYVDAQRTLAGARLLASLGGSAVPPSVAALAPLRSVLAYARRTGTVETTVASFEVT